MHTVPERPFINVFSDVTSYVSELMKALTDSPEIIGTAGWLMVRLFLRDLPFTGRGRSLLILLTWKSRC